MVDTFGKFGEGAKSVLDAIAESAYLSPQLAQTPVDLRSSGPWIDGLQTRLLHDKAVRMGQRHR